MAQRQNYLSFMGNDLRNLSDLKAYLRNHELRLRKSLSQNFIIDKNILKHIADVASIKQQEVILEVGPGLGAITRTLLEKGARVCCVELDRGFANLLPEILSDFEGSFSLIEGDILKQEFEEPMKVVSNIPFQITSPLLDYFSKHSSLFSKLYLVVQDDLCDRMLATSGSRQNNAFALYCQFYFTLKKHFRISRTSFFPIPKVDSALVSLIRKDQYPLPAENHDDFFSLIRRGFQQKRKMLRSSLKDLPVSEALKSLGLKETSRPEDLSLDEYVSLFLFISSAEKADPQEDK